jgi:hypothetical protein
MARSRTLFRPAIRRRGQPASSGRLRQSRVRLETTENTHEKPKEGGDVVEQFIGYIVTLLVIAGMGLVLPRWFDWRRSLVNRWPSERQDAGLV